MTEEAVNDTYGNVYVIVHDDTGREVKLPFCFQKLNIEEDDWNDDYIPTWNKMLALPHGHTIKAEIRISKKGESITDSIDKLSFF